MYEDVSIELSAFPPGSRVFCIASSGCTAIALSAAHRVTAVDINPTQLEYAKRRAEGAGAEAGAAERVMDIGRYALKVVGWRRGMLEAFLNLENPAEQVAYWNHHLDTGAFRAALELMLSVTWLKVVYASPLLASLPAHFARVMRSRMARCWALHSNRANPYARALLLGELAKPAAQASLIEFAHDDAASYLEKSPPSSFDAFTLSNILDGASPAYRKRLWKAVQHAGTAESVCVFRSFSEPALPLPGNLAARDRSMLWGVVLACPVKDLPISIDTSC
jgi:S-adenosylmethionine:diacylglycerol 3-amino-3-carboxypropyl transferase